MNILNGPEEDRILFYINRLGSDKAKAKCLEVARLYRNGVLCNGRNGRPFCFASIPLYRRKYIESYLHFKRVALE